ncbi:MAG: putative oxidoreductase [Frankiales bacterium]|nr:putative oxidoreductase [Frankiales bacterium]
MAGAVGSPVGWDADPVVAASARRPPLTERLSADVCVIGLGGSGLAAVEEARRRGLSVIGLDAGRVGAGAAGRNGGFLLGGPAIALGQAAAAWGRPAALELYAATLAELDALAESLGPQIVRRVGSIRLAGLPGEPADAAEEADRAVELADCQAQERLLRANGIAVEGYHGPLGRGLYLPDDAAMNPARRVLAMAACCERGGHGAVLFEDSAMTSLQPGLVRTAGGSVAAGLVVIAVDGRLELVLPELAGRVRTARLQMLAAEPTVTAAAGGWRLPCPVYGRWGYDYAQQDPSGRLFVGGGRDQFAAAEWTPEREPSRPVQGWIERVAARFAGQPVRVTHRWAASVGFTPDARALVTMPRPGVVACGGYNGTGNLIGPLAARAALALGLDGTEPPPYFNRL